jgi:2'-hydroxyisoflavone reductase
MDILLIGGGVFLGAAALQSALARGHRLTVFNRGRARRAWPDRVEVRVGDRTTDLGRLAGRRWDAVIDTCGYVPADVQASADALRTSGAYLFVSSVSVYASTRQAPVREDDALAPHAGIARDDRDLAHYGPQKAACEAEVGRVFGERALIVRPGLIVGPGDRSGRFGYWPRRVAAGGKMLVPDAPAGAPLQVIDVRDLADWMIALLERGARGCFNGTGPADAPVIDWDALIGACQAEAAARGLAPARAVRVDEAFLTEHGVQPWTELPLWLPSADPESTGFNRIDIARARATGLRTRALRETVAAVLDEPVPPGDGPRRTGPLTPAQEVTLLAQWSARGRPDGAATVA